MDFMIVLPKLAMAAALLVADLTPKEVSDAESLAGRYFSSEHGLLDQRRIDGMRDDERALSNAVSAPDRAMAFHFGEIQPSSLPRHLRSCCAGGLQAAQVGCKLRRLS